MAASSKNFLFVLFYSLFLAGCSSTPTLSSGQASSKEDFNNLSVDQGVVVGSFLVQTLPRASGEIEPGLFSGGVSSDKDRFTLRFVGTTLFATTHDLDALGNKEEFFVKKLIAGFYRFEDISAGGINFKLPFNDSFRIEPGKVMYIGRIQVTVPAVLRGGVRYSVVRVNNLEATKAQIADVHPELISKILVNPADKQLFSSTPPDTPISNPKESSPK